MVIDISPRKLVTVEMSIKREEKKSLLVSERNVYVNVNMIWMIAQ
jgi:hypothetical protein